MFFGRESASRCAKSIKFPVFSIMIREFGRGEQFA
jgi:hypothetical protein